MKNIVKTELQILDAVQADLQASRRQGRFEDVLLCVEEIFVMHKFTESAAVKVRCAALLSAPEVRQQAA